MIKTPRGIPNFPKIQSFLAKSIDSEKEITPINHRSSLLIAEPKNFPISGPEVVQKYGNFLSEFEKIEILEYDCVHFIGHKAKKLTGDDRFDNDK